MPGSRDDAMQEPTRTQVDALEGATVLEFGASWCGHCAATRPAIDASLAVHPQVRHLKIEDGRGRPLGRSYRVTLWPTLVLLRDGVERARLVRPTNTAEIAEAMKCIDTSTQATHGMS